VAGILLTNAGRAILYSSVPWSHKLVSLKTSSFPKGAVPKHLAPYLFKKGGVPASCARDTAGKAGAARVLAMNSCVSAALRK